MKGVEPTCRVCVGNIDVPVNDPHVATSENKLWECNPDGPSALLYDTNNPKPFLIDRVEMHGAVKIAEQSRDKTLKKSWKKGSNRKKNALSMKKTEFGKT